MNYTEGISQLKDVPLFSLLNPTKTGITFNNKLTESDTLNILNQANVYNGGGVGIGDFNNDGLPDIYLAANMVSNKLYLNKGALQFTDITNESATSGNGHWCTGVSVVDINNDGWLDIYVSASFRSDAARRTNLLYINKGLNDKGIPVFKESAAAYGLADAGFSTQGIFFDYDLDGDLDMYLVTNELYDDKTPIRFRPKVTDGSAKNTDRLYRNNGNETFTNVSKEAGILIEGWGHAVCITDINLDGWPDVYVANDFISNDLLYINNKNGTFTNQIAAYFKHTAWNAMGTAMSDLNNDGLTDLVSLEMLPEGNLRKKRMLSGNEYYNYFNAQKFGYQHQYVRNTLQLNKGMSAEGHPVFSDIGYMAGMYETDWSWCPLLADFDNDGLRDMVLTNGLPRDVTDLDYITFNNGQGGGRGNFKLSMVDSLPIVKLPNYSFKNIDGRSFANTSADWGFTKSCFSNGAAYADLDGDGDLDIVINNINENAFLYENTAAKKNSLLTKQQLTVQLKGSEKNIQGFGATIRIYYDGHQQLYEQQPCRGYLSTVENKAWFTVPGITVIDSLRIRWPDGKTQLMTGVKNGQTITLSWTDAAGNIPASMPSKTKTIYKEESANMGIRYQHKERDAIDYNQQAAIPHKLSQYGPGIAVGDIDNNGYDDFMLGASVGGKELFFLQDAKGTFSIDSTRLQLGDQHPAEDMGVLFFDADNDGDLDLYVVSGSYELAPNQPSSQDVLYFNDGKGQFEPRYSALPRMFTNGSCVKAADFDADGDLDLFIGGRVISASYPQAPPSMLLMNYSGTFIDVTAKFAKELQTIGMVTDALWTDFDNDGKPDLVICGEWMPISFFRNTGSSLENITAGSGLQSYTGWWNSLVSGDFDKDGDMDYIAGNLGLNSNYKGTEKEPMWLYAKDFDENGLYDPLVFCYMKAEDSSRKPFPMSTRDDMISQMIGIRKRFPTYKAYGVATMDIILPAKAREDAMVLKATQMNTAYIENKGNGQFVLTALPAAAQEAPVFGMYTEDVNEDGNLDIIMSGNDFGMEPYSGRHDAFMGLCLTGDGKGQFNALSIQESGIYIKGDGKGLASILLAGNQSALLSTQNLGPLLAFKKANTPATSKYIKLKPDDFIIEITDRDNKKRKVEAYYGSTFLSQSSRYIIADKNTLSISVTNYKGEQRNLSF